MNRTTIRTLILSASAIICSSMTLFAGPPTVDDVGDVASFGKNAQFLGAASGFLQLAATCAPSPAPSASPSGSPATTTQCFVLNPPGSTTAYRRPEYRANQPSGRRSQGCHLSNPDLLHQLSAAEPDRGPGSKRQVPLQRDTQHLQHGAERSFHHRSEYWSSRRWGPDFCLYARSLQC